MHKVLFYTRNDASSHVIIKNMIAGFSEKSEVVLFNFKDIFKIKKKIKKTECGLVYHDDPIAMFLFYVFGFKVFRVFHSLEMYEYQVEVNSLKRVLRFILFKYLHRFSLKYSDLIIFSNDLRRDFYLQKYSWLSKDKTKIIENIPMGLQKLSSNVPPEAAIAKKFSAKFKKTLVIAGAIGEGRDIEAIINAFERQDQYGLCIITQSTIDLTVNDSLLVFKNLPHEKVLSLYGFFDAGLLLYDNTPLNVKYCAPTKMYEYLSKGLYLLGNDNYSLRNNGYVDFYFTEPSDVFKALDSISDLPSKEGKRFDFYKVFDDVFKDQEN